MRPALPALLALSLLALAPWGCSSSGSATSSTSGSGTTGTGASGSTGTHSTSTSSTGSHGSSSGGTHGTIGGSIGSVGATSSSSASSASGSSGSTGDVDAGPDGGFAVSCGVDAGRPVGGTCAGECQHGFHCGPQGTCILNGGDGPLQVTLRFDQGEDLDLHVVEPGNCEVFYGNRSCVGSLDLDSNAGCGLDNVDIENVIYPDPDGGVAPPSGQYIVRVDFYANCDQTQSVPFQVEVRKNGQLSIYCGGFGSADDHGSAGSGLTVATFTYP